MPLLHECAREGCDVLTMGEFCVAHEGTTAGDAANEVELTDALTAVVSAVGDRQEVPRPPATPA